MLNPLEQLQILYVMMMILIPMGIFGMIGEFLDNRIAKKHWFSLQLDDMYQKLDEGIEVRPSHYLK